MRYLLLLTAASLLAPTARAQEEKQVNPAVVKAVRALLSAKESDRAALEAELFARTDLDWPSVKEGLMAGPYYQKPLVTAYGARHSGKHLGIRLRGKDGKERGFSFWVPRGYDGKEPIPVLFYLHHASNAPMGGEARAEVALMKFKDLCEKFNFIFVSPYTSAGAEWWTVEGRKLVEWTLLQLKERYNIDEDRVALMGAMDGGDAAWLLGQDLPGTFSCLMPMSGDPYEYSAIVRPIFLGTLDRMDILTGVGAKVRSTVGEKNTNQILDGYKPLFDQRMRITAGIYPTAQGDFSYLEQIEDQVAAWVLSKKRKPLADEVDLETAEPDGLRGLWLRNDGVDPEGDVFREFKSTRLVWAAPKAHEAQKKIGINLEKRPKWEFGAVITQSSGAAQEAGVLPGDVLLEVDGVQVKEVADVGELVKKHEWNEEVHLVLAREIKESELPRMKKREAFLRKVREKVLALRAEGKPVPRNIADSMEEDATDEEESEDDGDSVIEISEGDPKPGGGGKTKVGKAEATLFYPIERWVQVRREAGLLVRNDFGISDWDRTFHQEGVRITGIIAESLAARSGFRPGDVIVQVGDTAVKSVHDMVEYFKDFKFEDEAKEERFVDFTVKREDASHQWEEKTLSARWDPPDSSRVDARWDKRQNILNIISRYASGCTVYFTDELIAPGTEFHLYINGVPYQDLVSPDEAPDYPKVHLGSDPMAGDELHRMRQRRALVPGWEPDLKWAVADVMERRDRGLVMGAFRTFDFKKMKDGFEKARKKTPHEGENKWEKIKKAYDDFHANG